MYIRLLVNWQDQSEIGCITCNREKRQREKRRDTKKSVATKREKKKKQNYSKETKSVATKIEEIKRYSRKVKDRNDRKRKDKNEVILVSIIY